MESYGGKSMATALDVANFFIDSAKDTENPMTNMRVNKYVYLAQGYALAKLGRPLFRDEIQAWEHGPVVPALYQLFKSDIRDEPIRSMRGGYGRNTFSDDEIQVMIDVLMDFDEYSTEAISRMTHGKDSPWSKAYCGRYSNNPISLDDMKEYFAQRVERSYIDRYAESRQDPGYMDANGHYVLPAEFDDGDE